MRVWAETQVPQATELKMKKQNVVQCWGRTMRRHLEHLSTSRFGLQVELRPKYGRSLSCVGGLSADLDLILGDVLI